MTSRIPPSSELAYNVLLDAYEYNFPDRKPRQHLRVRKLVKQPTVSGLLAKETPIVPPLAPTEEERIEVDDSAVGVWVGMRPSQTLDGKSKASKAKGASVNSHKGQHLIHYDTSAMRVIAPLNKENANYYCLANPEQGLCVAYHTSIDEVFFFPEFRDDNASSVQARRDSWGKKVRDACQMKKEESWPRLYDKTKFLVDPKRSMANDLSQHMASYQRTGDTIWLRKAMDLIKTASQNEEFHPIKPNVNLHKLTTPQELSQEEATAALQELEALAPDLKILHIQPHEIRSTSEAVTTANVVLEYRLLRAFIVEFVRALRSDSSKNLSQLASTTRDHVSLQIGPVTVYPDCYKGGFGRFIQAEMTAMETIQQHIRDSVQGLKDSQGSNILSGGPSMPQIWTKFGEAPDVDSAKLYGAHIHRYNVEAVTQIFQTLQDLLRKHMAMLQELKDSIVDDSEGDTDDEE